ncbi:MAG: zinc chelation protein SecC [Rubrivivax sp.]|nr:zinc chelation protein SecC [Rubrivivax sp.]
MSPAPPPASVLPLRPRDYEDAARVAISWLAERHRKGWRSAFEDLLDHWRPEGPEDGWQLDEDGMTMVSINAGEWLIARGQIHARRGLRDINAYLLGRDGPYLTPGQKAWIAQLRERPLRLYRVTDLRPGVGVTLVDELDAQAEPQAVRERSGSRSARPGMLMGARIMQVGDATDGHQELSGAIYPFAKLREMQVLTQVRQVLAGAAALKLHAENVRVLAETEIARAWLAQWFEPAPLPQILDAATGDPVLLVTDHYRVREAAALAAALAAQPDVSGDAQQGWHRDTRGDDGLLRSLAAINPGRESDRIEVFYRTQRLADEGRAWFEALAGSAVQHLTCEMADPVGSLAHADEAGDVDAPTAAASPASGLPPEALAQALEQVIHRHYAHWCDEAIPALGGLTPRQAIVTPAGLERVKGLLREYEDGERRQSAAQGRPAVSYQFLWDAVGISR